MKVLQPFQSKHFIQYASHPKTVQLLISSLDSFCPKLSMETRLNTHCRFQDLIRLSRSHQNAQGLLSVQRSLDQSSVALHAASVVYLIARGENAAAYALINSFIYGIASLHLAAGQSAAPGGSESFSAVCTVSFIHFDLC